jgi:FixJ family two-component response regulator
MTAVTPPISPTGTVFVIDDDASVRRALQRQLKTLGFVVETYDSAQAYLARPAPDGIACIVSDLRMPGMDGLDLQSTLDVSGRALPMVFISGHGDIPTTVQAMKGGAVDFIAKPFREEQIVRSVREALAKSRKCLAAEQEDAALRARYDTLTPRERDVFALVAEGLLNKLVADRLGIAERTTKIHRARVMDKMGAHSLAELVRMADRLGAPRA